LQLLRKHIDHKDTNYLSLGNSWTRGNYLFIIRLTYTDICHAMANINSQNVVKLTIIIYYNIYI